MLTYVFPGQGSQVRGMGKELFAEFPEQTAQASHLLGYKIDELCLQDPNQQLNQTQYTQPALYVVTALSYLKHKKQVQKGPNFVAGHSLGEYSALFAADVFDFVTGLRLVQKRGELMSRATNGGMAAVVGLSAEAVQDIINKNSLHDISIANYNSTKQLVISGLQSAVTASESIFLNAGATLFMPLRVSGAFHSPYMHEAAVSFATCVNQCHFKQPTIPVIANVTAKPYVMEDIAAQLVKQITSPVLWTQSIDYLLSQGDMQFEEIGPGKVLTGLIARIKNGQ